MLSRYSVITILFVLGGGIFPALTPLALMPQEFHWTQLWTAHWLHFGAAHALLNLLALVVCTEIAVVHLGRRFMPLFWALGSPVIALCVLAMEPDLIEYRGASGLVTGLLFALGTSLWQRSVRFRPLLGLAAGLLLLKFWGESRGLNWNSLPIEIHSAWSAHVGGAFTGILSGYGVSRRRWM